MDYHRLILARPIKIKFEAPLRICRAKKQIARTVLIALKGGPLYIHAQPLQQPPQLRQTAADLRIGPRKGPSGSASGSRADGM